MTTTLLAVDDSKTMRKVLEITFAGEDYRTVLAGNSAEALQKLKSEKPAVALVDAQLGEENGYDLCQAIKQASPGVAVVILSSKQRPYDRARGTGAGADDFMDKPFDTQQLIDKVAAVVRKATDVSARPPAAAPSPAAPAVAPAPRPAPQPAARPAPARPSPAQTLAFGTPAGDRSQKPAVSPPSVARPQPPAAAARPADLATSVRSRAPAVPAEPARPAPAAPAPAVTPKPSPVGAPAAQRPIAPASPAAARPAEAVAAKSGELADKLSGLGLTREQVAGVLELSREVIEQVVWEVVPVLAETMIQEEIKRLTSE